MIEIKIISELEEAKKLWNLISPQKTIYDLWDFRFAYYQADRAPLNFQAAFDGDKLVALLPLQFSREYDCFEFFAEEFVEDNRLFFLPGYKKLVPRLYDNVQGAIKVYDLSGEDDFTVRLPLEDYVYYQDLKGINNLEDYLKTLPAKKRRNFSRDFRVLEAQGKIDIIYNRFADFDKLFALNHSRFGDESYLKEERIKKVHRDLLKLPYDWQMISLEVNGELAAVSLAVLYNQVYYYLNSGADFLKFRESGNYLNRLNLEKAINLQAKIFNVGLGDCGWKKRWNFTTVPQYKFVREA